MLYPSLDEAKQLFKNYGTVPVFHELLIDNFTPVRMFAILKENYENCFILESVDNSNQWGRYSYIGLNPKLEIRVANKKAEFIHTDGRRETVDGSDPIGLFSGLMEKYRSPKFIGRPKLTGGLIGYFGYDMARYYEKKLTNIPKDDLGMPDANMFIYNELVAYDHLSNRAVIILGMVKEEIEEQASRTGVSFDEAAEYMYNSLSDRAEKLGKLLCRYTPEPAPRNLSPASLKITSNYTKEEYMAMVEKCREHIRGGDISQIVPSQRFEAENPPDPFDVYRMLRSTNPSPYLYYFDHKDYSIAGASPEMLVSVCDGKILNKPIAGTSPRGATAEEDAEFEKKLTSDPKERAEHCMLVDLGRNDVGRVSKTGTVKVTEFMRVERYSKVMHLVSDVEGELREDKTAVDALMSVLPAGTLSGAPKVKAMEIIDSLENVKRGLYGGTVGYMAWNGDIDTCIAIRTVLFRNGKAYVQAGGGVVYDSDPEYEYAETCRKAAAVINALEKAAEIN
ncbi:MAG: anthranilate synthase component I [Oscillospiraceae bacterium]|nr:anthranilate synthase component I [Oscillospiraceae bacterium]